MLFLHYLSKLEHPILPALIFEIHSISYNLPYTWSLLTRRKKPFVSTLTFLGPCLNLLLNFPHLPTLFSLFPDLTLSSVFKPAIPNVGFISFSQNDLPGRYHKIVLFMKLRHFPHCFHIILRISSVHRYSMKITDCWYYLSYHSEYACIAYSCYSGDPCKYSGNSLYWPEGDAVHCSQLC